MPDGSSKKQWMRRPRLVAREHAVDKRDDADSPAVKDAFLQVPQREKCKSLLLRGGTKSFVISLDKGLEQRRGMSTSGTTWWRSKVTAFCGRGSMKWWKKRHWLSQAGFGKGSSKGPPFSCCPPISTRWSSLRLPYAAAAFSESNERLTSKHSMCWVVKTPRFHERLRWRWIWQRVHVVVVPRSSLPIIPTVP